MTQPRRTLVSLTHTPYYHCIGRCVRRAFLCGFDAASGKNFEHRKQWIAERLALLADAFTIDVCAFAIMTNHYHLVLRINPEKARTLSDADVLARWGKLYSNPEPLQRFASASKTPVDTGPDAVQPHSIADARGARNRIAVLRERLADLSWFMRCLNEPIARRANREDNCTGRFWEGRFKSQALLDEAALISCMSYVDLNPIRAAMATTPEASDYTSIQQRLRCDLTSRVLPSSGIPAETTAIRLLAFRQHGRHGQNSQGMREGSDHLPCTFADYLALVEGMGRLLQTGKRGAIPRNTPLIIERLGINPERLLNHLEGNKGLGFGTAMGRVESLRAAARKMQKRWLGGIAEAKALFSHCQDQTLNVSNSIGLRRV